MVLLLLNLGIKYLIRGNKAYDQIFLIKNVLLIELIEAVCVISINLIIPLSAALYGASPIFILLADLLFLNYFFSKNNQTTLYKRIFLYCLSIIPSFLLSIIITNFLFGLGGIQNAVMFYF
jgi:hypothetical protein